MKYVPQPTSENKNIMYYRHQNAYFESMDFAAIGMSNFHFSIVFISNVVAFQ